MEYRMPEPDTSECLLLEYGIIFRDGLGRESKMGSDYQIARGKDSIKEYFRDNFGEEGEIPELLSRVDRVRMERILSGIKRNGQTVEATLYLCDIGHRSGIKEVYSKSGTFRFPE